MIGPEASALAFACELELGVGDEQDLLQQVVDALAGLGGHVRELRRPAPLLGLELVRHQLLPDLLRVGLGLVDLVHGDEHRNLGGAGVVDGLHGLRHDAVVGGYDQHGDVRHLGAAGAQGGERLVAGRVEERDPPAVVVDLVGADVLRDAAGLGLDDRALADRVEERRLAVVDVAHDRDHGRPGRQIVGVVLVDLGLELLLVGVLDLDLPLRLGGDEHDRLVGERLRDGDHLADVHHDLDDLGHRDAERRGQLLDGRARVHLDWAGLRRRGLLRRSLLLRGIALLACVRARARGLRVDDHAALAAPSRRAAARSQWSLTIRHGSSLILSYRRFQSGRDCDRAPERPRERSPRLRLLEAGRPPAGVRAASRQRPPVVRLEHARRRREARELPLRRLPPAADARSDGVAHDAGCSSSSTAASASTPSASLSASSASGSSKPPTGTASDGSSSSPASSRAASSRCAGIPQ